MPNIKKLNQLLKEKSAGMAKRRGDEYNAFLFSQMGGTAAKLTDAERRVCNMYLFGSTWDRMTIADLERLP